MPRKRPSDREPDQPTEADVAFVPVVQAFTGDPRVVFGRMMASPGLKVDGKIFAMLSRGRFVVKLPRERVDGLVASGGAERFDPGHGRVMKEWAVIRLAPAQWLALAREAYAFVAAG